MLLIKCQFCAGSAPCNLLKTPSQCYAACRDAACCAAQPAAGVEARLCLHMFRCTLLGLIANAQHNNTRDASY